MKHRNKNIVYGNETKLVFDLTDLKFKRREREFLPDNEAPVFTRRAVYGNYMFVFRTIRKGGAREFLSVFVSELDMPYVNLILEDNARKNGFSIEHDVRALIISEKKYKEIKEGL